MSRKDQKSWDLDTLLSTDGFKFEIWKVLIDALRKRGGTKEHLKRLLNEPKLVEKIASLIVSAGSDVTSGRSLLKDEYLVHVGYDMPCDKRKLEREFSKGGVAGFFCGDYEWHPHLSCVGIDQSPGERVIFLKHFDRSISSEESIAVMDKLGYRPATHHELYAFAKANPELQRQIWIVALGSFVMSTTIRSVAVLDSNCYGRRLTDLCFETPWPPSARFLCVRKDAMS